MTKARTNATTAPAVGRNMVINGAMNVAQRSASVTGIGAAAGYFTCDRWKIETASSAGRLTMTQTADGPNGISANCLKLDCTTADTSIAALEYLIISQYLEGQNLQRIGKGVVGAKQVTISFYVKANAAFDFVAEIRDFDNGRTISKLFATTTDWVRHEILIPADVDDGSSPFDDDNASSAVLNFWLHAGSNYTSGTLATEWANLSNTTRAAGIDSFFSSTDNNLFITGVQMEVGPVATEFEQEEISITLSKCQRYYQRIAAASDAYKRFGNLYAQTTTNVLLQIPLIQTLRAIPTIVTTGTAANYGIEHENTVTATNAALSIKTNADDGTQSPHVYVSTTVGSGLTAGNGGVLVANNNASAFIGIDSEL